MAKTERKDDGRRCYACKGPQTNGVMPRWMITQIEEPHGEAVVDMHDVCVGSWLMGNEGQKHTIQFQQGEIR